MKQYCKTRRLLPGFRLTLGFTLFYLSVVVLIPMSAMILRGSGMGWGGFWKYVLDPRAIAAYKLSLVASMTAALLNVLFGTLLAWVLVRYTFPGRRLMDALVDVPFALPTAVAGLTLGNLYGPQGWIGQWLAPMGIAGVNSRFGVVIALMFVSLPFVVRTVQPVLETFEQEVEEAAATLGAGRWRTFFRVVLPTLLPSIITGFALAFARALGEFGSIQFVSGSIPFRTEIAPQILIQHLDEHETAGAIAVALFLLIISFLILGTINLIESWARRFQN